MRHSNQPIINAMSYLLADAPVCGCEIDETRETVRARDISAHIDTILDIQEGVGEIGGEG